MGSSVARYLSSRFNVTILDPRPPQDFSGRYEVCDLRDERSLSKLLRGFDLVVNTAIVQIPEINDKKRMGYEVNVLGTQNLCEAVRSVDSIKGLLQASSWHVFGERGLEGTLSEEFGYHPDRIEERARLYALCKIAQETIVRIVSETCDKSFGIIRLGTVLGETMPRLTAANIFIEKALKGEPMTPFKHTQYRPMLYVDIQDVCKAFEIFATLILDGKRDYSAAKILNLVYSTPFTILEIAKIIKTTVIKLTHQKKKPSIKIIDNGQRALYSPNAKALFRVNNSEARRFLGIEKLVDPRRSIERITRARIDAIGK